MSTIVLNLSASGTGTGKILGEEVAVGPRRFDELFCSVSADGVSVCHSGIPIGNEVLGGTKRLQT